jgi:hypothetical protein
VSELRDRGLLAYHLQDFGAALRDLETYLRLLPRHTEEPTSLDLILETGEDPAQGDDSDDDGVQVWEHIKNLRKRVAGFN